MTATRAKLTERQAAVFAYIVEHAKEHGIPPTRRQIMEHFGWKCPNATVHHVLALARAGLVANEPTGGRLVITAGKRCKCCGGLGRIIDPKVEGA